MRVGVLTFTATITWRHGCFRRGRAEPHTWHHVRPVRRTMLVSLSAHSQQPRRSQQTFRHRYDNSVLPTCIRASYFLVQSEISYLWSKIVWCVTTQRNFRNLLCCDILNQYCVIFLHFYFRVTDYENACVFTCGCLSVSRVFMQFCLTHFEGSRV